MVAASPVPRRVRTPKWLDLRLIAGVVLVLASVVVGAKVVASSDSTQRMWAASRDLAAGSVLTTSDVRLVRVRLPESAGSYLGPGAQPRGQMLSRPLATGELVPRSALGDVSAGTTITVPVDAQNAPKVTRGQRIQLWLSTASCSAVTVVADVTVQDVQSGGGGAFAAGDGQSLVIRVPPALAARVVTALAFPDAVIRAGILDGTAGSNAELAPLAGCGKTP